MPIFEFKCKQCGHAFSKIVWSHKSEASIPCPKCDSARTEKLISSFASISQSSSSATGDCSGNACGGAFT